MSAWRYAHIGKCKFPPFDPTQRRTASKIFTFSSCSNPWATLGGSSGSPHTTPSPSAELDPLLAQLSSTFVFLSRALAAAPLRRIARSVLATISTTLWDTVVTRHRFSTTGAAQLNADLAAICRVVDEAVGSGVAEAGLRKCLEGARLVGLPVKGGRLASTSGSGPRGSIGTTGSGGPAEEAEGETDDWGAWGATEGEEEVGGGDAEGDRTPGAEEGLGLWEVERRLFADNQSAREVLDELGLETLSEAEARTALGRRVELAG